MNLVQMNILCTELVFRDFSDMKGVSVGGVNINNLFMLMTLYFAQRMKQIYNMYWIL